MEDDLSVYGYVNNVAPHAAIRCKERYGVDLNNEDLNNISTICQGKTSDREYKKNLGFGKHQIFVKYKDIWFNCIYSSDTKMIVTILHPKTIPTSKI